MSRMYKYRKKPGVQSHITKMSDNPPLPKAHQSIDLKPGDHVILMVREQRVRDWKFFLVEKEFIFVKKYPFYYSFEDLNGFRESFSAHELREIMVKRKS